MSALNVRLCSFILVKLSGTKFFMPLLRYKFYYFRQWECSIGSICTTVFWIFCMFLYIFIHSIDFCTPKMLQFSKNYTHAFPSTDKVSIAIQRAVLVENFLGKNFPLQENFHSQGCINYSRRLKIRQVGCERTLTLITKV